MYDIPSEAECDGQRTCRLNRGLLLRTQNVSAHHRVFGLELERDFLGLGLRR